MALPATRTFREDGEMFGLKTARTFLDYAPRSLLHIFKLGATLLDAEINHPFFLQSRFSTAIFSTVRALCWWKSNITACSFSLHPSEKPDFH